MMPPSWNWRQFCSAGTALILLLTLLPALQTSAQERCGLAKDLTVQALERIKTGAKPEVEDGLQLLKHSNEVCASFGDAWYYRSLFEQKLSQAAKANYSLGKAKLFGSEAMDQGANPFVLAAPVQPGENKLPPVREKWGLVVGISQFHNARLNLRYTSKDAKDLAAVLVDPKSGRFKPSNVHVLADAEVTTRKLKEELNWLARMAQEDDLVVIFLATHGTSRRDDTAEVNYIVTSDTELQPQDSLFATAMAMVDLSDIVRTRIKARRTAIFLDTCHSGAATSSLKERATALTDSSPSAATLERIRQGVGRAILTSSQEDQVSYEGPPFQNGYFTHFLLEALRQNNGMDTIEQVYAYVKDQLPKAIAARNGPQRGVSLKNEPAATPKQLAQTPVLSSSELGAEIVLGIPPASTKSAPGVAKSASPGP
jgi:uncharacterized caspase-like protein